MLKSHLAFYLYTYSNHLKLFRTTTCYVKDMLKGLNFHYHLAKIFTYLYSNNEEW